MGVDPWVDRGTCPPYFLKWRGRPVFCPPYFLGVDIVCNAQRALITFTYIAVFVCLLLVTIRFVFYSACQMSDFKAKMHQIRFRLGIRPRPRWGSLQRSPDPLAGFNGPTSQGRGEGRVGKGRGRGGMRRGLIRASIRSPYFFLQVYATGHY